MFWNVSKSVRRSRVVYRFGLATLTCFLIVGAPVRAQTDTCNLEGSWKDRDTEVKFTWTAEYTLKNGTESLTGKYVQPSPSNETGEAKGSGRTGDWTLTFVSKGPGNTGYSRDLTGEGAKDPLTGFLRLDGKYTLKKNGVETGQEGVFEIAGRCIAQPKK